MTVRCSNAEAFVDLHVSCLVTQVEFKPSDDVSEIERKRVINTDRQCGDNNKRVSMCRIYVKAIFLTSVIL